MRLKKWFFLLGALLLLPSCMNMATTGAQAVYNRQQLQKSLNDHYLTMRSYRALDIDSPLFKNANISVSTLNGEILLTGQVPEAWQKAEAEKILKTIPGIKHIYDLLTVEQPLPQVARAKDAWITTKVKAQLMASNDVDASQVKVLTENGVVYLMGILPPSEAKEATSIAATTKGVKGVVKIFTYVKISKSPD